MLTFVSQNISEEELIFRTMSLIRDTSLSIISIYFIPTLRHRIFCESTSLGDVQRLIRLLPTHLVVNKTPSLVSIDERVATLTLPAERSLTMGSWLRMRQGLYKGDLVCYEKDDDEDPTRLVTWVVPRIRLEGVGGRPDAAPFDAQRVGKVRPGPNGTFKFKGHLFRDGLCMLRQRHSWYLTDFNGPSTQELRGFLAARSWLKPQLARFLDLPWVSTSLSATQLTSLINRNRELQTGQPVTVVGEQLQGLKGNVVSVQADTVFITACHKDLDALNVLAVNIANIRRYFAVGHHVITLFGQHMGQWGMVTVVDETRSRLVFLDSTSMTEASFFLILSPHFQFVR